MERHASSLPESAPLSVGVRTRRSRRRSSNWAGKDIAEICDVRGSYDGRQIKDLVMPICNKLARNVENARS